MNTSIPHHRIESVITSALPLLARRCLLPSIVALTIGLALPISAMAQGNTKYGDEALRSVTTGSYNTAFGVNALADNTTGSQNTAVGNVALDHNTTASDNTAIGWAALAQSNGALNTAVGSGALYSNLDGIGNVAGGGQALHSNQNGWYNVASGSEALFSNNGDFNTASGARALYTNTTGTRNTAAGYTALFNSTGNNNTALGVEAGLNLSTGSNNIVIGAGVLGGAGDANTIRIGKKGTQTATYIAGIYSKGVASATGVNVKVDSTGKLGTVLSSARYKDHIKPMDKASEAILQLEPVTFQYNKDVDLDGFPQFGLIAEQVEKIDPNLVVRDEDGNVSTVRYEAVNAMLLNEFLKEHRKVRELERNAQKQGAQITQQRKQIEALTAIVQKVSDRSN